MKTPLLSDREADSADYRALAATGPDRAERIARTMNFIVLELRARRRGRPSVLGPA